jgi:hypothetical protein
MSEHERLTYFTLHDDIPFHYFPTNYVLYFFLIRPEAETTKKKNQGKHLKTLIQAIFLVVVKT